MTADRVAAWTRWLALLLGVGYLAAALVGLFADFAEGSDKAFWVLLLGGGGILVLAGFFRSAGLPAGVALVLAAVGALAGALALFWTIVVPVLAIAFVVLLVLRARNAAMS